MRIRPFQPQVVAGFHRVDRDQSFPGDEQPVVAVIVELAALHGHLRRGQARIRLADPRAVAVDVAAGGDHIEQDVSARGCGQTAVKVAIEVAVLDVHRGGRLADDIDEQAVIQAGAVDHVALRRVAAEGERTAAEDGDTVMRVQFEEGITHSNGFQVIDAIVFDINTVARVLVGVDLRQADRPVAQDV